MPRKIMNASSGLLLIGLLTILGILLLNRSPESVATFQSPLPMDTPTPVLSGPCLTATDAGFVFDFYGYVDNGDETYTLTYGVTNPNKKDISYVAFGTDGWTRIEPSDGMIATLGLGIYNVEWTNNNGNPGFTSIKHETQFDGFSKGATDTFTIIVSDFDPAVPIQVQSKAGKDKGTVTFTLDDPACDKTPPTPTPLPTPTQPSSPLETPTPDPNQGINVLPQIDVVLGPNEEGRPYTGFIPLRIEGEQLIGRGSTGTGESHLVSVDLGTGQVERLSDISIGRSGSAAEPVVMYGDLAIQPSYASWPNNTAIEITNISSGERQVTELGVSRNSSMNFQDGLAVWTTTNDHNMDSPGLYSYLLGSEEAFLIQLNEVDRFVVHPYVCNAEWISYMISIPHPHYSDARQYEVWAYHHPTDDKIHLGVTPPMGYGGRENLGLRCDKTHLIWLERTAGAVDNYYRLWYFDLDTRESRVLADDALGASTELRIYDDILWNWNTVYDLNSGAIVEARPPSTGGGSYSSVLINDALVRVVDESPLRLAIVRLERNTP